MLAFKILVPTARLELAQLSPLPPQDSVSTNFTTSAKSYILTRFTLFVQCTITAKCCKSTLFLTYLGIWPALPDAGAGTAGTVLGFCVPTSLEEVAGAEVAGIRSMTPP